MPISMRKYHLPDDDGTQKELTDEEIEIMMRPQYPRPNPAVPEEMLSLVESAMVGVTGAYAHCGHAKPLFLCVEEDKLSVNFIAGFNEKTAHMVEATLKEKVQEFGYIVFVDEVYFMGVTKQQLMETQLELKKVKKLPGKKEGIVVRLMTKEFDIAWMNETVGKDLTGWRLIMDSRDPHCHTTALDIKTDAPVASERLKKVKNLPTAGADEQSFAN